MSLIKKIVEIVERSDSVDARKNISKLNKDIAFHKEKVKQYIDSNYVDFMPTILDNGMLLEEGKRFENELTNVKENINNEKKSMYQANDAISKFVEELDEANFKLALSMKFMKIDKLLAKIKSFNGQENFSAVNQTINEIHLLLNDPEDKIIRRLDMYKSLKIRLQAEKENMLKCLEDRFSNLVQMKEKSFQKTRAVNVNISKDEEKLIDSVNSIVDSDYNFGTVTDFFMDNVFEPIITRPVLLKIETNERELCLAASYSTETISEELRPNHVDVFAKIEQVLAFLVHMNVRLRNGNYFLAQIFEPRQKELMDLIFSKCLVHSIPKTFEEKTKSTMTADIAKLSKDFIDFNLFSESSENLENYSEKVDSLFHQQFTKNIEAAASEILKRDLHDMILISEDTTLSTTTPLTFPRSMVSKSTLELIRLLEKIINQAKNDAEEMKSNLMLSVKTVLENYPFTVQLHHSKFMSKIPQQSALFYNNCMYLSNYIMLNSDTEYHGMDDVVKELEKQGWEILECQIAKQKIQLLEILNEFDPSQSLNNLRPEHFKPIRQCLRQMDLLKNVWQTILPSDLYNKTMAGLIDVIIADVIKKVTLMEDISTTLSNGLVDLFKNIDEKGQSLFEANTGAVSIVPSWQRMVHLQFILDASLVDITNSWKAGQISQSFKVEEVKRLIRALFQNTDRRANALSSIA